MQDAVALYTKSVPVSRSMVSERSVGYFETRVDSGTLKSDGNR